jgi:hypothetical protein
MEGSHVLTYTKIKSGWNTCLNNNNVVYKKKIGVNISIIPKMGLSSLDET